MNTRLLLLTLLALTNVCSAISPTIHKLEINRTTSAASSLFGYSVALNDRYIVVSSAQDTLFGVESTVGVGAVYVYDATSRKLLRTLKPDVITGSGSSGMFFGFEVAVSGSKIIVGAPGYANRAGAVFLFDMAKPASTPPMKLQAFDGVANDFFGYSVALEGEAALIGAAGRTSNRGAAYLFNARTGTGSWLLTDSSPVANDSMGTCVRLSGEIALVSASFTTGGSIRRYNVRTGNFISEVFASDANPSHSFGNSLAVSGHLLVAGDGRNDTGGSDRGAFHLSSSLTNTFMTRRQVSDAQNSDKMSSSVAASGGLILIGGTGRQSQRGLAVLFDRSGQELAKLTPLDIDGPDSFGFAVAIDGSRALVSAPNDRNVKGEFAAGSVYVFEGLAGRMDGSLLARRGNAAPGTIGGVLANLGLPTVNQVGVSIYSSAVKSSSKGGPTLGVFTNLGPGSAPPQYAAGLNNTDLASILGGGFAGAKLLSVGQPSMTYDFAGQFLATLTGTGINSGNRTVLIQATNTPSVSSLLRTGDSVAALGNSTLASISSVVGMEGSPALRFTLKPGTGDATAESDTGYGTPNFSAFSREGTVTPAGGGELFGQFDPWVSGSGSDFSFSSRVIAVDGSVTLGVFNRSGGTVTRIANSLTVPSIPGAEFKQFISSVPGAYRGIIAGGGSTSANNDGIWSQSSGVLVRKGDQVEAGVFIKRIESYWLYNSNQVLVQVQLTGTANSSNNRGLYYRQTGGNYRRILRTGSPVAGLSGATVSSIQRVDASPVSFRGYAVLVGLKGTASSANQALLVGDLTLGGDDPSYPLREPRVLLQKGQPYTTTLGTPARISALNIFSAARADGVGNPGIGCSIFDRQVAVRLDFSDKSQELWLAYWR